MFRLPRPDEAYEQTLREEAEHAASLAHVAAWHAHVAACEELEKTKKGRTILQVLQTRKPNLSPEANAKSAGVSLATYFRVLKDRRFRDYEAIWARFENFSRGPVLDDGDASELPKPAEFYADFPRWDPSRR